MKPTDWEHEVRVVLNQIRNSDDSTWNKATFALGRRLKSLCDGEVGKATSAPVGDTFSEVIQKFVDNPMTPEEEAKGLRAMLHAGIFTGDLPSNLLNVLEKTIGVSSGDDNVIEVVDFKDAFPDMESAKQIAMKMIEEQMK